MTSPFDLRPATSLTSSTAGIRPSGPERGDSGRFTLTGHVLYADTSKGDAHRLTVRLRVETRRQQGIDLDLDRGVYRGWKWVTGTRDEYCYVRMATLEGQLLGSMCRQAEKRSAPLTVTVQQTKWGLEITGVEQPTPEPQEAA